MASCARWALAASLATLVLSGCVEPPAGTSDDLPPLDMVRYASCSEHLGRFPVPRAELAAFLPADFAPVPFGEDSAGLGVAILLTLACDRVEIAGVDAGEILDMWALVPVTPPALYADDETDVAIAFLGSIVTSEPLAGTLAAWGMEAVVLGERVQDEPVETPALREGVSSASAAGIEVEMRSSVRGIATTADGSTRYRLFGVDPETKEVTGAMDLRWSDPVGMSGEARIVAGAAGSPFGVFAKGSPIGLAVHYWGDDYDAELRRVALPALASAATP